MSHNKVILTKERWCIVSSKLSHVNGKTSMVGHSTSSKCETYNVSVCLSLRFPYFRLHHSMAFLQNTLRKSRDYYLESGSDNPLSHGVSSASQQSVTTTSSNEPEGVIAPTINVPIQILLHLC